MLTFCSDQFKNSIHLGICFVLLFSACFGLGNIVKTLTNSMKSENPSFNVDGYTMTGILYIAFSISMWTSPGIVGKIGSKYSMILSAFFTGMSIGSFYFADNLILCIGSILGGIGASILWTGQANYIVLNSGIGKVYKQIGVFWILYQSSHLFGNLIVYWEFSGITGPPDQWMRRRIVTICLGFVLLSILCMFCLRAPARKKDTKEKRNPLEDIWKCCKISATKHIAILCVTMVTCGMHMSFLRVLSATVGFTQYLSENSKELVPICGLLEGVGEMLGGFLSSLAGGKKIYKLKPILTIGCLGNMISYTIILLAIPDSALNSYSKDLPILILPTDLVLGTSLLVGIGDACYHTELYDHLGALYPDDSASAFAVYKFVRSLAAAFSLFYARYMALHLQVITLMVLCLSSFVSYHCLILHSPKKKVISEHLPETVLTSLPGT